MKNSLLCNNKISDYKHKEKKFNNGNTENNILSNIRHKNIYNSHRFYTNKEQDIILNNLSQINSKIYRLDSYKSNSKEKKEELNYDDRASFKTKNHNYLTINTKNDTTYHSCEKNQKKYKNNDYNRQSNNIRTIENELHTPRIINKINNYDYQKNNNDLTKNICKKRDNYGYHEIKDVKKSNVTQNKNNKCECGNFNMEQKNKYLSNYLSININNNNSFRHSLNNNLNNNNQSSTTNYSNSNGKHNTHSAINSNNNINNRKYSYLNFKTVDNCFEPPKNIIQEESIFSSYKNIKNNYKELDNKNIYNNAIDSNKFPLIRKIYMKNTPEEKRPQNIQCSYIKRNDRNKKKETKKENEKNIYTNMYLSGNFKDIMNTEKNKDNKNNKTENKKDNYMTQLNNLGKYSPFKTEDSQNINNSKKDFNSIHIMNKTDKIISKQNSKYEINYLLNNINNNDKNKPLSSNIIKNETNIQNVYKMNNKLIKINSKDNIKSSLNLKNQNIKILKEENNKEKPEKKMIDFNNNKNSNNIKHINNYEIKDNKNNNININLNLNKRRQKQKMQLLNNNTIDNIKNSNSPFNKRKDLTEGKNRLKDIIKKKCKSSEKSDNITKNNINKKRVEEVAKHASRSKTKSKAKKHSNKVKYLDKLKHFKYSETNYNIYYDSSTNCSNNNNYKYKKYALRATRSNSRKKKNINYFNLNYKSFEEDFKIDENNINSKYQCLKPQISVRITLSKRNNVNIIGLLRYFKVNYFCSENLRNNYDIDSEDTSEYYNAKF